MQILDVSPLPGWVGPSLENWSVIIDIPRATTSVILETSTTHSFRYAAGDPWAFSGVEAAAAPGPLVHLAFASPVIQIRLRGKGLLFAIRVPAPSQTGVVPLHCVRFVDEHWPHAPDGSHAGDSEILEPLSQRI